MDKCKYYHTHTWGEPPLEPGENGTIETEFQCKKMNNREVSCCGDLELCELPSWEDELRKKEIQYVTNFQGHNAECDTFPTGYILVTDAEKLIESLLKKQRESCAEIALKNYGMDLQGYAFEILNAPEPGEK